MLCGAATLEHLSANLSARQVHWDDAAAAGLAGLAEQPDVYWRTRGTLVWN
jgi:aryl-alcohol dehydrogenase-like predicted oxidoreductase